MSGRTEEVVSDGAAASDFLMRNDSADNESVAIDEAGRRLQDAEYLLKHCGTAGNVTHDVVCEGRVKARVGKEQFLRDITMLEGHPVREIANTSEMVAVADAEFIDIDADHGATECLGELQGIPS